VSGAVDPGSADGAVLQAARRLGITIPPCPRPAGAYRPAVLVGDIAYTSGMGPARDGVRHHVGYVGGDISVGEAMDAARIAVLNAVATLQSVASSLDQVRRIVRLTGYVRSAPGFGDQPKVVDAASELLEQLFGEAGAHARSAIGVAELPFGISVEIELIAQLEIGNVREA
jgi:enamine deaminase RidA (YjgF/YER057c/UK114 family)